MSSNSSATIGLVFTYNKVITPSQQVQSSIRHRTLTLNMNKGANTTISPMNSIINNKAKGCSACGN
jgi:hypothetical protein